MRPGLVRLSILLVGFLAFLGVLIGNLAKIQLVEHGRYREIAAKQHVSIRRIPAKRGAILDRNRRPLAATLPAYRIFGDPRVVEDPEATASALARIIPLDAKRLARRLSERDRHYEPIELAVEVDKGLEVKRLGLDGICVEASGKRVRPLGDVACNLVGFLSAYEDALSGIELVFDTELRGKPGVRRYLRDALGTARPCVDTIVQMPVAGNSVILSIDADLQYLVEEALDAAVALNCAKGGCVVIVGPTTGDILAMTSMPGREDSAVRTIFEPGSSLKICTYAAALDLGRVDSTDVFDTNGGKLPVPGGWIRDDHPQGHPLSLREAFALSSNVAASLIARRIGRDDFYRYLRAFGFGAKTGLSLEGESRGILREPDEWSRRSLETLAIGQEIGVTAIQLTMAYAAIANGGLLMEPRLVKAIEDESGRIVKTYPAKTVRRVIRRETAAEMVGLLEAVVQEGTGTPAAIEGIRVAGKTGTGQKAVHGSYIPGKYYSVFAGLIPADEPKYVCLVMLDEPSAKSHYGGPVCGPVFKEIMCTLMKREKDLLPDDCVHLTMTGAAARQMVTAVASSSPAGLQPGAGGCDGQVYPAVKGLTLREAARVLVRAGLRWRASGTGVVAEQWPGAGEKISEPGVCRLSLGPAR
jgi:cell division protein FtsI/penicillin-binding protein 2